MENLDASLDASRKNYLLNRDSYESRRLIEQHHVWVKNQGYRVHPTIEATLPPNARIADIATGTGIWTLDLSHSTKDTHPSWTFDGFDISSAQFPSQDSVPSNVHLHIADVKRPFPAEFHGQFDMIHARLLLLAMDSMDWILVVNNMKTLLKPGGWIQWAEIDLEPMHTALRDKLGASTEYLQKGCDKLWELCRHRLSGACKNLFNAFKGAGLNDVVLDPVTSDRLPELREISTKVEMRVVLGVGKQAIQNGAEAAWSLEELEYVVAQMEKEAENGAYVVFYIKTVIGRKS
ncbi:hypothetical protein NA57DRAFT_76550 [Rhizodiscina lignyota]|uniref:S-adenosyl-L-methionine-dependent methyltransferase n=1 Tax=Rhizodiscina lignyota TaxID=1504668 RepID=A0A9P4IGG4_9PEZI|nr:hypothetical protein NA57DRAFT_76550 [Rhizodiscina lignyota]